MERNLKDKTASGLMWGAINNGTTQVLNLAFGICLARFLCPEDYGVVGVLTIFSTIAANLQDSGFTQALINLKAPTKRDYDSVFWFNTLMSVSLYAILFMCAPLLAGFFRMPCLIGVSRVTFLGFLIAALSISSGAYLKKNMKNREIAIINIVALLLSGVVGVLMALRDMAYWSLVAQQLTYISVITLGRFVCCRWLPSLKIDFKPVCRMMKFGIHVLATNVVNVLSQYLLTIVFAHKFTERAVGNFTQANKWNLMASQTVSGTMNQLAQTVLVEVVDDSERELRVFRKMLRFAAFLSMPAMLGLAMVSSEFIQVALGEKWASSALLMRILCVGGAFLPLYAMYQNLAVSSGRGRVYMWLSVSQVVAQLIVVLCFLGQGITAMVTAYVVFQIVWLAVWQIFACRYIGMKWKMLLSDVIPYLCASVVTMFATYYVTRCLESAWLLLLLRVAMASVLYLLIMYLLHDDIFMELKSRIKKK